MPARLRELATELGASSRNLADVFLNIPVYVVKSPSFFRTVGRAARGIMFVGSVDEYAASPKGILKQHTKSVHDNIRNHVCVGILLQKRVT